MKRSIKLEYNKSMRKSTSPKAQAAQLAEIAYPGSQIEVRGTRVKGKFGGYFLAEVYVNDRSVARARHRDWRTAYKGLNIEMSKAGIL